MTLTSEDNWAKKTITGLDKYSGGQEITYSWAEGNMPEGYSLTDTSVNGTVTTLTNSYDVKHTEASVVKVWNDSEDHDGFRPATLTVTGVANGKATDKSVTLTSEDNWAKKTITGLDKYSGGQEITYSWAEGNMPEGYSLTDTSVNGTVTTLTNSYDVKHTEASVVKVWNDSEDHDGFRPATLTVTLLANGKATDKSVTLTSEDNWAKKTITGLDKYSGGQEITYSWAEGNMPEGYSLTDTSVNGTVTTLTNSYDVKHTEASVVKVWNDSEDHDGFRPATLTVTLLANGKATDKSVTLTSEDNWAKKTITGLDKYSGGQEITYSWAEGNMPEGYSLTDTSVNGTVTTLTNSYDVKHTEASVVKVWNDSEDHDGFRPATLTVTRVANGKATDKSVTLTSEDNWAKKTITGLDKYSGGQEITYSWAEGNMPEGYSLTDTSANGTVTTLTNSYDVKHTEASVVKVWNDSEDHDGFRPATLTVTLLANGKATDKSVTLTSEDNWAKKTITGLDKYSGGQEITYSWAEGNMPEGYSLTDTSANGTVTTLTNSYDVKHTEASVVKVWNDSEDHDGFRPATLTVTLLANGKATDKSVTLTSEDNWAKKTITGLDKYSGGQEITYSWAEGNMPEGYSLTDTSVNGTVTTLTNSYDVKHTEASVVKVWNDSEDHDGFRPATLTVTLLANGKATDKSVTLTSEDNWAKKTITGLDKYSGGQEITYSWAEGNMPEGYSLTDTSVNGTVTTLTNSYDVKHTEASVVKVWNDSEDHDGFRPATLTVTLLANGKATDKSVTLTSEDNWAKKTITGLDKYSGGQDITYSWAEGNMPEGYSLTDHERERHGDDADEQL
ncbi:Cna B-type domain-containing protein [Clostridiales bacterium]|nr:Cna B-type domain-containing protein [Clostridiales bacterium]